MRKPTPDKARSVIRMIGHSTNWKDESAICDTAHLTLIADGYDAAMSRRAVDKAWREHFEITRPN